MSSSLYATATSLELFLHGLGWGIQTLAFRVECGGGGGFPRITDLEPLLMIEIATNRSVPPRSQWCNHSMKSIR
jgi:hypothetical protein